MIDPELRWTARIFRALMRPPTTAQGFRRMHWMTAQFMRFSGRSGLQISERSIPRRDGGQIRLLICRSRKSSSKKLPGVLWSHGGGYLIGVPEQDLLTFRHLIEASECVVVAPAYRRGLEAPYPAALEDCYDALLWLKQHADELGVRSDQLCAAGMSAGGGLTAALSLYARDLDEVKLAFQLPLYPMIDDRMQTASAIDNDAPVWNSASNQAAWQIYLGDRYGKNVPAYAAPARAVDYRGLPPTCTFVGDIEPFRDETIEYINNLKAVGVPTAFELYKGAYHAFDLLVPKAAVSQAARAFYLDWFKFAVKTYTAPQTTGKSAGSSRSS
jgi:acetyl esterase/lipase